MPSITVVLVRHGETPWNRADRIQGWAPVGLTDRGRRRSRALGESVASTYDVDRLVASDLCRCRETTALLREGGVDPAPTYERAWRERDVGVFQGLTRAELFGNYPEYAAGSGVMGARATPESGESLLDLRRRVLDGYERLIGRVDASETVLVVTHGGPIYVLLGHVRGLDLPEAFREHDHDNCAITELRVPDDSGDVAVVRESDRPDYPG